MPDTPARLSTLVPTSPDTEASPALAYLARLSKGKSRSTMQAALSTLAELAIGGHFTDPLQLPWHQLRAEHTSALRSELADRYSPAGANLRLAALRGVLKEAWRLGLMTAEDYHRAADLPSVRGSTLPAGRALSAGELRALFGACKDDPTPAGARDAALLALLYGAGLRRSEVIKLETEDYDASTGELRVRGKGGRERLAHASNGAADALAAWLEIRTEEPGPMFLPINRGGRLQLRRMTGQAVLLALRKRAAQAGVERFSPHDLRRTFVGDLLDAGADISVVQGMAGHASVVTTQRYDRRPAEAMRKASELLHVPF